MATNYHIRMHKRAWIGIKSLPFGNFFVDTLVWTDKKLSAHFSTREYAQEFIDTHHIPNADIVEDRSK